MFNQILAEHRCIQLDLASGFQGEDVIFEVITAIDDRLGVRYQSYNFTQETYVVLEHMERPKGALNA